MFEEAIQYPRRGEAAARTILIGGLLTIFGFLVLPAIAVLGYAVAVLRTSIDGADEPPAFEDWETLFVDGLKAFVIWLAYALVPFVLAMLGMLALVVPLGIASFTTGSASGAGSVVTGTGPSAGMGVLAVVLALVGLAILLVAAVAGLAALYVAPAALARFGETGDFGAAFALRELRTVVTTETYAVGWLLALVVSVVAGAVVGALAVVPVLGFVAGGFVAFYATVVAFRLYGASYAAATPGERGPETPSGQPAA